jgi:hypothetical protein
VQFKTLVTSDVTYPINIKLEIIKVPTHVWECKMFIQIENMESDPNAIS